MATGAWGTQAEERVPVKELPLINEVHIDGLVGVLYVQRAVQTTAGYSMMQCNAAKIASLPIVSGWFSPFTGEFVALPTAHLGNTDGSVIV